MDVPAKFSDYRFNSGDSVAGRTRLMHFAQYSIAFCSRPETASDVITDRFVRPIVLDKYVKCRDLCFNHSREIAPETVGSGIFDSFFAIRPEVVSGVIYGAAIGWVGMNILVKFGDCRSNRSRWG